MNTLGKVATVIGRGIVLVAGLLAVAACSDGDDSTSDTTATTPPPATEPPATTVTPTTTTTTTTSTTTSTTTTTLAPTTTIDPLVQLAADIERDLNLGEQALLAATADPSDPDLRAAVETYFQGVALGRVNEILDGLEAEGLRARANPDLPSALTVIEFLDLPAGADSVELRAKLCRVDAGVVFEPLPGGGEVIVDDEVSVLVSDSPIALTNGVWVLLGGELLESLGPEGDCEAA